MGKDSYQVTQDTCRKLLGIFVLSWHTIFSDHAYHPDFDLKHYFNSSLKAPRPDDCMDIVSTGSLKRIHRILHWILGHVLHPRIGGQSRLDQAEVHLMYLLQHKIHTNWKHYFSSRMFVVRYCNRGSSLCYASMIAKTLRHFCISVTNLPCISLDQTQEFNMTTMRHLGYHLNVNLKVYFYKMKGFGKVIYKYDDPSEFGIANTDEKYVEE